MRLTAKIQVEKEIKEITTWLGENIRAPEQEFIDKARRRNNLVAQLEIDKPRKNTATAGVEYVMPKG